MASTLHRQSGSCCIVYSTVLNTHIHTDTHFKVHNTHVSKRATPTSPPPNVSRLSSHVSWWWRWYSGDGGGPSAVPNYSVDAAGGCLSSGNGTLYHHLTLCSLSLRLRSLAYLACNSMSTSRRGSYSKTILDPLSSHYRSQDYIPHLTRVLRQSHFEKMIDNPINSLKYHLKAEPTQLPYSLPLEYYCKPNLLRNENFYYELGPWQISQLPIRVPLPLLHVCCNRHALGTFIFVCFLIPFPLPFRNLSSPNTKTLRNLSINIFLVTLI